jgi:hypothetical protein
VHDKDFNRKRADFVKVFNIKHDDQAIYLETIHTKFASLEKMMMLIAKEFILKGKKDVLKKILGCIEAMMI